MTVQPLRCEVLVGATRDVAFAAFTDEIGSWWPIERHGVGGAGGSVAFDGGEVVETLPDGTTSVWAEVLEWVPGERLRLDWHPGPVGGPSTEVDVSFEPVEGGTRVRLEHRGWDVLAGPEAARAEYAEGWPGVLTLYRRVAGEMRRPAPDWVALLHTPAPGVDAATVFTDPMFGEHRAFLQRLHARGWLVAAGPFDGLPGSGMTVVRVPAGVGIAEVERLARTDDIAVASGLLQVEVRPWRVVLSA